MSDFPLKSAFREALSRFASGVVIVAAYTPEGPVGFTASAFSSVSLEPALVLVCVGKSASAYGSMVAARRFGISVLHEKQGWIAEQFARSGIERFAGVPLATSPRVPWIAGALAQLECEPAALHDAGDHSILVGQVLEAQVAAGQPLVHYARSFGAFERGFGPSRREAKDEARSDS
jgi:flavin reductase (DIM6/NTAB) family NADH-FMN oxidoreductase RutF